MATEENAAKGAPPAPQAQPPTTAPAVAVAPPAASDEPKLTPAQLKAKAKAEKAARREKTKEVKAIVAAASTGPAAGDAKGAKGKGKQEGLQPGKPTHTHRASVSGRRPSFALMEKDARSSIPECFSHLPMAKRAQLSQAHKDVHPAVLAAGQQMATFAIKDSISRLEATLLAFKKVIHLEQSDGVTHGETHRSAFCEILDLGVEDVRDKVPRERVVLGCVV